MENLIYKFAKENNLIIGVCDAENMAEVSGVVSNTQTPFVVCQTVEKVSPKVVFPWAESIIVMGKGYGKTKKGFANAKYGDLQGNISLCGVGQDYHFVLKETLDNLAKILITKKQFRFEIFVDNGKLLERELARKAGLGSYGKNNNIISEKFGSFFNIGYIVTDLMLEKSIKTPMKNKECEDCNICIKSCPSGILNENIHEIDFNKCVSYLTQKKGRLTKGEMKTMGNNIYGCDACQNFCPCNKGKMIGKIENTDEHMPKIEYILNLTNAQFIEKYKNTASGWRGKKIFVRNGIIALGNSGKTEAFSILERYLKHEDEDLRYHSILALEILKESLYV